METLEQWDRALFLFLNGLNHEFLDMPMYIMTKAWCWIPVFVFLIFQVYRRYPVRKHLILVLLGVIVCVGANDLISYRGFKLNVKRYRPTHNLEIGHQVHTVNDFNGNEYRGGKYGFLSSHAANYFGIATYCFLALGSSKKYWWLFLWAGLIVYTRIYLGVHYPSDILCGGLLGVLVGWITFKLLQPYISKQTSPS